MYGWAMTCSETSSSLGVSHTGFVSVLEAWLGADSIVVGDSVVTFRSFISPPLPWVRHKTWAATARCSLPREKIHRRSRDVLLQSLHRSATRHDSRSTPLPASFAVG